MRTVFLTLAVLLIVAGCVANPKIVVFEKESINLHPLAAEVNEVEGATESGTELVVPDGSHVKLTGGGAAGNLTLTVMQNDGTEQDVDTSAQANVKSDDASIVTDDTNVETCDEEETP